jgi:pimeloyl-ACP methyl ester carboxylesterase
MLARTRRWIRTHPKLAATIVAASAFVAMNAVAFLHARAMTHFAERGERTRKPEALSAGEKIAALLRGVTIPRPANDGTPASCGLSYETVRFASLGAELEAWRVPREPCRGRVLLFHGYAASKSSLLSVALEFRGLGYETVLVDFRGSGGSSGNVTTLGVLEADDVASAVAHMGGEAPILYGLSMGSVAILRAIHAHALRPGSIIIECPFGRMLDTVEARFALMGLPVFPGARLLVFWGGMQLGFDGFAHEPVEYARSVRCPTLLLQGEADPTITLAQCREIFANLAGPKTLETFPGAGHGSILAFQPDGWRKAVRHFLTER